MEQQPKPCGTDSSARSRVSRDENDYKNSATTRTTRSRDGNDDENVTIKVTKATQEKIDRAKITHYKGRGIEIIQRESPDGRMTFKCQNSRDSTPEFSNTDLGNCSKIVPGPMRPFSSVHFTISRDNTRGEDVRQANLLADFSKRCSRCSRAETNMSVTLTTDFGSFDQSKLRYSRSRIEWSNREDLDWESCY